MALNWSRDSKPHPNHLPAFKKLSGLLFWLAVGVVGLVTFWLLMTAGAGD